MFSFILMISIAVIGANSLLLSPILTNVASDLGTVPFRIAWAITAYNGATALSALFLAPFIDKWGLVKSIKWALMTLILGTLLAGVSFHWVMLTMGQLLAGLAAGVALPAIYALAPMIAPKGEEAKIVGRVLTGWSVALVAGIPLGTFLTDQFGWRIVYYVLATISAFALFSYYLRSHLMLHIQPALSPKAPRATFLKNLFSPFTIASVPSLLAINFLYMTAFYGIYTYVPTYLKVLRGISATEAGAIILFYGIGFGIGSFMDRFIDRLGAGMALLSSLLAITGVYLLIPLDFVTGQFVYGIFLLWGLVNHFGLNCVIVLLGQAKTLNKGRVMGMNSAITYLGGSMGSAIFGMIYHSASFLTICIIAAGLTALAAFISGWQRIRNADLSLKGSWLKTSSSREKSEEVI